MTRAALPALFALLALPLGAQEPGTAPPADTFFEKLDVPIAEIEVVVTDREGRPVSGLGREDFELRVDGEPVEIANFYAAAAPAGPPSGEAAAGGSAAAAPPARPAVHLAVLVDETTLTPASRTAAVRSLERLLSETRGPGTRYLLAAYDGTATEVRWRGSEDAAGLSKALEGIAAGAPRTAAFAERLRILRGIETAYDPATAPANVDPAPIAEGLHREIEMLARRQRDESRRKIASFAAFFDGLAGLAGRKAVVLVSGGFALQQERELFLVWEEKFRDIERNLDVSPFDRLDPETSPLLASLAARANAGRITVYTLALPEEIAAAELLRSVSLLAAGDGTDALATLAGETGGAFTSGRNAAGLVEEARADLASYYSLGFAPPSRRSGKDHSIDVRVRDRSLKVRHRSAWRAQTAVQHMQQRTRSALLFGEAENPHELSIVLEGEAPAEGGGKKDAPRELTVLVRFPLAHLVLLPKGEHHEGRATLFFATRDLRGRMSDVTVVDVPLRVPNDQLLTAIGQVAGYRTTLRIRPEEHVVAVALRDDLGHTESAVTSVYRPGELSAGPREDP